MELVFAGQVVGNGIHCPIPGKLASVAHWEPPNNIAEMRAFLGFCNYHSAYVHMYTKHTTSLTKLL